MNSVGIVYTDAMASAESTAYRPVETRLRGILPHLGENDICRLAEICRRLIDAYEPDRLYLFGSKARGDCGPDSDFDVMVIVPDGVSEGRTSSRLAYQALRGTGTAADVLVTTRGRFERRLHVRASLPATVMREGVLLHGS